MTAIDYNISVGIVKEETITFCEPPNELPLECGKKLGPITIAYETYGTLNPQKNNAILITHALSGDHHAAGYYTEEDRKPGWWETIIGPGKPIDTNRYYVICSNCIGSCMGSTGPSSINPETGTYYGLDFPVITIGDMVKAQSYLLDHLGIDRLMCVIGGSMGGMQVLEWTRLFPDRVYAAIPVATTAIHSAQNIAMNEVGRQAILSDPNWNHGNYYDAEPPKHGLAVARMVGHISYLSESSMHEKFGRRLQDKDKLSFDFDFDFQVESYLRYQGYAFTKRFDANSYLYITKALDYFDLSNGSDSLTTAFRDVKSKFLVISFTGDWLYPPHQSKQIVKALKHNEVNVSYYEVESDYGHDAFLLDNEKQSAVITSFLEATWEEISSHDA